MNRIGYILIAVLFGIIVLQWFYPRNEPENRDYEKEMTLEIDQLKKEIIEIHRELTIQYEKIDTVTTSGGAVEHISDFIKRTGNRKPPQRR